MRRSTFWLIFFVAAHRFSVAQPNVKRSVLLPASAVQGSSVKGLFAGLKLQGFWTPNEVQLASLEKNLPALSSIGAEGALKGAHIDHPELYFRQYIAVVLDGRRFIYLNAFCGYNDGSKAPADWQTRWILIWDGGTCVWHALYDPDTGRFAHLVTNGLA